MNPFMVVIILLLIVSFILGYIIDQYLPTFKTDISEEWNHYDSYREEEWRENLNKEDD